MLSAHPSQDERANLSQQQFDIYGLDSLTPRSVEMGRGGVIPLVRLTNDCLCTALDAICRSRGDAIEAHEICWSKVGIYAGLKFLNV
jgi:hypothetical protein